MGLRREEYQSRILYFAPTSDGTSAFQERNLGLPVKEIGQDEFLANVFGQYKGHLCVFRKNRDGRVSQGFYKNNKEGSKKMETFLKFSSDTYISYSTYYKGFRTEKGEELRTQKNIVHTYMLVQDLDYYKLGMTDAECLKKLGEMINDGEIICPNYLISTGRGYQLIWLVKPFKNIEGFTNDRDWRAVQEHLYTKLRDLNSDSVVKNPSAVTRLVGTTHTASRNKVYGFLANSAELELKDFIFFHEIVPAADRAVKPRKLKKSSKSVTRIVAKWNEFTLNRQREEDIFIFVRVQNERGQSYIGIRNWLALVLYFHSLVSSDGDSEYARGRVLDLCNEMNMDETSEDEILRRSRLAERYYKQWVNDSWDRNKYVRGGLFYTNARMLELMNIKEDYYLQWQMKTIKIKNKEYEAARKRFERLAKGETKGSMEQYNERRKKDVESKIDELRASLEENPKLKNNQLAEMLGVHRNTISKLKKLI
jgi:hypothetical protein